MHLDPMLLMVQYGEKKKLVRKTGSYETLISSIRAKFSLEDKELILETPIEDLGVVEFGPDVFEVIVEALEVVVVLVATANDASAVRVAREADISLDKDWNDEQSDNNDHDDDVEEDELDEEQPPPSPTPTPAPLRDLSPFLPTPEWDQSSPAKIKFTPALTRIKSEPTDNPASLFDDDSNVVYMHASPSQRPSAPSPSHLSSQHSSSVQKQEFPEQQLTVSGEDKFEVQLESPAGKRLEFRVRGKHSVRKVLFRACTVFGVEVDSAGLHHVMITTSGGPEEEWDGEEHIVPCDTNMSLVDAGVGPGSLLRVVLR